MAGHDARAALPTHRFVMKTDIALFYVSIDHHRLLDRLARVGGS